MLKTLDEINDRLVQQYDPERIILFGSHALDAAVAGSDIDLLVVKETSERPIDRRVRVETILAERAMPLDILVYTPEELRHLYAIGSPFVEEVIETGRVLYMRNVTQSWLRDAEDELSTAVILLQNGKYKSACYHSQQCVEKCLKALILEKGEKPEKVHDIVELLAHVNRLGWTVGISIDDAVFLNSIYKGRYPTEEGLLPYGEPIKADADKAGKAADSLMKKTAGLIR
jgi:uncharacterized protein